MKMCPVTNVSLCCRTKLSPRMAAGKSGSKSGARAGSRSKKGNYPTSTVVVANSRFLSTCSLVILSHSGEAGAGGQDCQDLPDHRGGGRDPGGGGRVTTGPACLALLLAHALGFNFSAYARPVTTLFCQHLYLTDPV